MEVKDWKYDEYPGLTEEVPGATYISTSENYGGSRPLLNVVYAERNGLPLHLQMLQPRSRARRLAPERGQQPLALPCLVYVQGSAWRKQDTYQELPQLARLAAHGIFVAVVEYRDASIAPFPAQIYDAQRAVRFMAQHAEEYGIDPAKIVMGGSSSGGHTATFSVLVPEEDGTPAGELPVRGVIDLYGAVSLLHEDGYPATVAGGLPESPEGMMMGGVNLREDLAARRRGTATEYIHDQTPLPPFLIAHGTKDRTVSPYLSVELFQHLRATGHEAELLLLEGADHGSPEFFAPESLRHYEDFIARVTAS